MELEKNNSEFHVGTHKKTVKAILRRRIKLEASHILIEKYITKL